MAKSDEGKPVVLEPVEDRTGCFESACISGRDIITIEQIEQTDRAVLKWVTLMDDGRTVQGILQVDVGEPPHDGIRTLAKMKLEQLPLEAAVSHPVRHGIMLREGGSIRSLLEPISYQDLVDDIAELARFRAEDAMFSIIAKARSIPGWTSQSGTWAELTQAQTSYVASRTGLPELHLREGDRVIAHLREPIDGVIVIVLRGEVGFDDRVGWTGIEKLIACNFHVPPNGLDDMIESLPRRLLPADNQSLRIEPFRVLGELSDLLRIHHEEPVVGKAL